MTSSCDPFNLPMSSLPRLPIPRPPVLLNPARVASPLVVSPTRDIEQDVSIVKYSTFSWGTRDRPGYAAPAICRKRCHLPPAVCKNLPPRKPTTYPSRRARPLPFLSYPPPPRAGIEDESNPNRSLGTRADMEILRRAATCQSSSHCYAPAASSLVRKSQ